MKNTPLSSTVARSQKIREIYHLLELEHHGSEWTVEEDALAFLTDAGLVGRLTMAQQRRWPMDEESNPSLEHKIGECIWWLIVLAGRMQIDAGSALEAFLTRTEEQMEVSVQKTAGPAPKTKVNGRTKKTPGPTAASATGKGATQSERKKRKG